MPLHRHAETDMDAGQREFFIPDLCEPQPTLFLILLMELLVLVYVLASSPLPRFNWDQFAIASLFAQWLLLLSAWLLCRSRDRFSRLSLPLATLACLGLVTLTTLTSSVFVQVYFVEIIGPSNSTWWILRNLLIANVLAAILLRYLYLQQQLRLREQWVLQARLDSLRARIRPHFLFNTLNSIASLIISRPDAAEQAVEDLAELFRASLKESNGQTTVQDEVRLTELYLGIERIRLGERLTVDWNIDDTLRDAPMPSLIIQPLAENAVYHGISRLSSGGCIGIHIGREASSLLASVTNPVPPKESGTEGNHMALANVRQRLEALYGTEASMRTSCSNDIFKIELRYPSTQNMN